jgi:hypothetical protein
MIHTCVDGYSPNQNIWWLTKKNCVACLTERIADFEKWLDILQQPTWYPDSSNTRAKRASIQSSIEYVKHHLSEVST